MTFLAGLMTGAFTVLASIVIIGCVGQLKDWF